MTEPRKTLAELYAEGFTIHYYPFVNEQTHPGLSKGPSIKTEDLMFVNCQQCLLLYTSGYEPNI